MTSLFVQRRGGLGDTLLMLPVLRALRRAHPAAALHFAGVREFAEVLRAFGAVDAVHSTEDFATWRLANGGGDEVRARLRAFDLVIADDPAIGAAANDGTDVRGFDLVVRGDAPFGMQLAERLGLRPKWPDDALLSAPAATGAAVAIAPGSGGRTKCWPRDRWLELVGSLAARGVRVDVVVGPVEIERDDPRRWPWPAPVAFVVEESVVALALRLQTARVFAGNDSGTTHLAAALGVPTVVLFGPTDARVWAPPGDHVCVIAGDAAMGGIDVANVAAAVVQGNRARTRCQ